jgi:hypothetical protein
MLGGNAVGIKVDFQELAMAVADVNASWAIGRKTDTVILCPTCLEKLMKNSDVVVKVYQLYYYEVEDIDADEVCGMCGCEF